MSKKISLIRSNSTYAHPYTQESFHNKSFFFSFFFFFQSTIKEVKKKKKTFLFDFFFFWEKLFCLTYIPFSNTFQYTLNFKARYPSHIHMYIPNFKSSYVPILSDIHVAAGTKAASSKDFSPLNFLSTHPKNKGTVFCKKWFDEFLLEASLDCGCQLILNSLLTRAIYNYILKRRATFCWIFFSYFLFCFVLFFVSELKKSCPYSFIKLFYGNLYKPHVLFYSWYKISCRNRNPTAPIAFLMHRK